MQEKKKAYKCYVCDEEVSILYNFTSINENNNNYTLSKNKENSIICHRICAKCLVRHIFLNEIKVFEKDSMNNSFTCPCTKGKINLDYERLMDVFQNAIFQNLLKKNGYNEEKNNNDGENEKLMENNNKININDGDEKEDEKKNENEVLKNIPKVTSNLDKSRKIANNLEKQSKQNFYLIV